jgi:ubiquinone/menaquinone biosynthesis C-methylase UbiE
VSTTKNTIKYYNVNSKQYTDHLKFNENGRYHIYYEKPAMKKLLPNLKGKKVLCLGCGSGEEMEYLTKLGAKCTGVDISKELIKIAKDKFPKTDFYVGSMEKLKFQDESFDFVYSSLAIHYIKDWTKVLKEVKRILKPGSYFLFSTEHPVMGALKWTINNDKEKSRQLSIYTDKKTKKVTIIGDYLNRRLEKDVWGPNTVDSWHKSIGEIAGEIKKAGLLIESFVEPRPLKEMKKISPNTYEKLMLIPSFMIFRLLKP